MARRGTKSKDEYPPLLPDGLHPMSVAELKAMVVDAFPRSARRPTLWANFANIINRLEAAGIRCEIWVDGSFLTYKNEPDDIDFVVDIHVDFLNYSTPQQTSLIKDIGDQIFRIDKDLDSYLMFNAPAGHQFLPASKNIHDQWRSDFGKSFVKKEPKGIAVLTVSP